MEGVHLRMNKHVQRNVADSSEEGSVDPSARSEAKHRNYRGKDRSTHEGVALAVCDTSALRGIPVRMKDISPAALEAGMGEARRQLARQMHQGKLTQSRADAVLASITPQIDDRAMDGAELVIEAVAENLSVKHKVLAELEQSIFQDAVLASNTSSLRINDIAAHLARPQNVVGLHFFNPVPVMPLVEVVRGSRSSASAVATATAYVSSLGKTPIVVKDCPGFLVNRILTP